MKWQERLGSVTRVLLVRHGETSANAEGRVQGSGLDLPLNEIGRQQALDLGMRLKQLGFNFDKIMSSGLKRARETAEIIAACLEDQSLVHEEHGLNEMSYGRFEGQRLRDIAPEIMEISKTWAEGSVHVRCPGEDGESPQEVLERGTGTLRAVLNGHCRPGNDVLCVTHSRLNMVLLAHLSGQGLTKMQRVKQQNCCVNVVDFDHETQEFYVQATNLGLADLTENDCNNSNL